MCGIYVPGLPVVPGGARDASLFLSWFYDRYNPAWRELIRRAMQARGIKDVLLSWPDARAHGCTPQQFGAVCQELIAAGFYPCPMLYSKDYDPSDFAGIQANIQPVLPYIVGVVPRMCVGWELSIVLSPTVVQQLIDWLCPLFTPAGTKCYVHFQQGYFSYQQDGNPGAAFWNLQPGKLTGILHQRVQEGADAWDKPMYQARIVDCLQRFAGQFGYTPDSGFGHPFDFIALEIVAEDAYNNDMSEADQNSWGQTALTTPGVQGPLELVVVQGSGNGE